MNLLTEWSALPGPAVAGDGNDDTEFLRVLIVDDSPELVTYVQRLLSGQCVVSAAADGRAGLEAALQGNPDLVLIDVAMPKMDGLALLRAIRAHEEIRTVPVIMLSADASEESRLEALDAGADDYLVKPFRPRELIARVRAHVRLVRFRRAAVRRESELLRDLGVMQQNLESVLEGTSDAYMSLDRNQRILALNAAACRLLNTSVAAASGRFLAELAPALSGSGLAEAVESVLAEGRLLSLEQCHDPSGRWFSLRCYPASHGVIVLGADITERKRAEKALQQAHLELEDRVIRRTAELRTAKELVCAVFDRAPGGMALLDLQRNCIRVNGAYRRLIGHGEEAQAGIALKERVDAADWVRMDAMLDRLAEGACESFELEARYVRLDGTRFWASCFFSVIREEDGRPSYFVKIMQDVSDRKRAEARVRESQLELRNLYARLQQAREEERLKLARDVHDQLGQILSAAKIDIKLLEDDVHRQEVPIPRRTLLSELRSARNALDRAIETVRGIATELRYPALEDHGLFGAVRLHAQEFASRSRIRCEVSIREEAGEPCRAAATALFQICQEAMTNVMRHAQAKEVRIDIRERRGILLMRITDDGIGIPRSMARNARSIGLQGMRERAALVRGQLLIRRLQTGGTHLVVRVPLYPDVFDTGAS